MLPIQVKHQGKALPWLTLSLRKSLDEVCHSATITLGQIYSLAPHSRLTIHWQKQLLSTLMIDAIELRLGALQRLYTISLRSPARDIIDSSWDGEYSGSLQQVASKVAAKFNLQLQLAQGVQTQKIEDFVIEAESPWDRLVSQAAAQGLVFTTLPDGNLILAAISSSQPFQLDSALICSLSMRFEASKQFSNYLFRNQPTAGEPLEIEQQDTSCQGQRIYSQNCRGYHSSEALKKRLMGEIKRRRQPHYSIQYQAWQQDNTLWDVNTVLQLDYQDQQAELLLSGIVFEANATQLRSSLDLQPQEAYL